MKNKIYLIGVTMFLFSVNLISAQEQTSMPVQSNQPVPVAVSTQVSNKITLDIKGMDIIDALKMLAARAGMDIVVGKNVSGRVTLFLKDVDVWDAFEIMLSANDLAYEKKGSIINVMSQKDYELKYGERYQDKKEVKIILLKYAKAADLSRALNQIKSNVGKIVADEGSNALAVIDTPEKIKEIESFIKNADLPIQTRVYSLNYAQADKLQPKIQEILTKNIGYIKIDERTNKLVVTDYVQKLDEVSSIVSAFDDKTPQVLIDAQVIQLTPTDKFEMGVNWDYWIEKYFDIKASLPIGTANRLFFGTPNTDPTKPGGYKAIVDVLQTIGDTKVLASPRVMALNNQEAKIHVGTRDAYITSTTSQSGTGTTVTSQSVNFVDTGIQLYVTPSINRDGFVTMKIKPEISDSTRTNITSEGQITQIPIVTTSEAETTVMVKDGVTIVIGGLKKNKRDKTVKKIPILADIPWLGVLFRSTSDDFTNQELVILLTPHIITGEDSYLNFTEIKPKKGGVLSMVKGEIVAERLPKPVPEIKLKPQEKDNLSELIKTKESAIAKAVETFEEKKFASADDSLNRDYYKLITSKISSSTFFRDAKNKKGKVELLFILSPDGKLKSPPTVLYSTNQKLNKTAVKCIEAASPFPPFPEGIRRTEEEFRVALEYK